MTDRPLSLHEVIARHRAALDRRERPVLAAMREAYAQARDGLATALALVIARIVEAREAGEPVDEGWLIRQARYQRLLAQADAEYARFADEATNLLTTAQREFAQAGATDAAALMTAVGVAPLTANLPATAMTQLVGSFAPGSPLRAAVESYGALASEVIRQRLIEAVSGGLGARRVARQITRDLDSPALLARMLALVRTETMRSYRGGTVEQYQRNVHLLQGLRWVAAHSSRTCLACLARSGRDYPVDQPPTDFHVACRCTVVPVTRSSSVALPETGEEWLARQPTSFQRERLGQAYDAFASGEVELDDFVEVRQSNRWGASVHERSARDVVRRAG